MQSIAFLALNDQQYIGEMDRSLQARFSEHKGYVLNKYLKKATGRHFNQPGHRISDMQVSILEKVHNSDINFRKKQVDSVIGSSGLNLESYQINGFPLLNILSVSPCLDEFQISLGFNFDDFPY